MFRKLIVVALIGFLPALALAQPEAGNWELTLQGSGSNNDGFTSGQAGIDLGIGYFYSKELEISLRQGLTYDDDNMGTDWDGSTRVALDYHFDLDQWQPFIGASIGFFYGDATDDQWAGGPEGGVKYFVNRSTFILLSAQYFFSFEGDFSENAENGIWLYTLGIGFQW